MKSIISILSILILSSNAFGIDNSDCPTGRAGQAKATRANFEKVLEPGSRWFANGTSYRDSTFINFIDYATFKIGYDGQAKKAPREILVENDIGRTKFSGALILNGKLRVELDEIYFTIIEGRCALITKTNPDEYHPSTAGYPSNDMRNHKIQDDNGNLIPLPKLPWQKTQHIHVMRKYHWVRDERF